MADQLPYCIHCGAQQLNPGARFCYQCGRPIVPVTMGRPQLPPWVGPVLVSAGIIFVAVIVFSRLLAGGPAASRPAAATPAPSAETHTPTPVGSLPSPTVPAALPTAEAAPTRETPKLPPTETPTPAETPQPAPTLANITPEPVKLSRLAWSPDGRLLAVGSGTGVYLYDTTTWQEARFVPVKVSVPSSLEDGVDDLAFSFDGALLGAAGQRVQVWRVADGALACEIQASRQLAASPTEGLWATAGDSYNPGNVRLWQASDGQLVREIRTGVQFVASIAFSSDGQLIASGPMVDGSPTVWRTADGQRAGQLNWGQAEMFGWVDFAFHPNTSTVVAVGTDDVLLFWDTSTGGMRLLSGPNDMTKSPVVNRVSYAPDGNLFATSHSAGPGRQGGSVQLWSADGTRGQAWQTAAMPKDVEFSPDSRLLAATDEQTIYIWRLEDKTLLNQVQPVWHQGILPTPTPTPLHVGLNVPADWREYVALDQRFRLRFPSSWYVEWEGLNDVHFRKVISSNPLELLDVSIETTGCWGSDGDAPGSPALLDAIRKRNESSSWSQITFIAGGKWPYMVPGTYGEFQETITGSATRSHKIELRAKLGDRQCVAVTMVDDRNEISEDDRQDLGRILASIEFADQQHPLTPPPVVAPEHARLPVHLYQSQAFFSRTSSGDCGEWSVEIRDGEGRPVQGAQLRVLGSPRPSAYDSVDGRITWRICPNADKSPIEVEVYLNGKLTKKTSLSIWWR